MITAPGHWQFKINKCFYSTAANNNEQYEEKSKMTMSSDN